MPTLPRINKPPSERSGTRAPPLLHSGPTPESHTVSTQKAEPVKNEPAASSEVAALFFKYGRELAEAATTELRKDETVASLSSAWEHERKRRIGWQAGFAGVVAVLALMSGVATKLWGMVESYGDYRAETAVANAIESAEEVTQKVEVVTTQTKLDDMQQLVMAMQTLQVERDAYAEIMLSAALRKKPVPPKPESLIEAEKAVRELR